MPLHPHLTRLSPNELSPNELGPNELGPTST